MAVVDTVLAITPDPSEPLAMKWVEIADEKNWDQLRQIFEPSAEKLCQAGLHTKVLIRRGNPADQILEDANTWARIVFSSVQEGREASIVCYLVVFPPRFQRVPLLS